MTDADTVRPVDDLILGLSDEDHIRGCLPPLRHEAKLGISNTHADRAHFALDRLVAERDALAAERDVLQAKVTHRLVVTTNQTGAELIEELRAERDRLLRWADDIAAEATALIEATEPYVASDGSRVTRVVSGVSFTKMRELLAALDAVKGGNQ